VVPGAQDVSVHDEGAFTGEVSARMLRDAGAQYVIVGHSERRMLHGETNSQVGAKAHRVLINGITPIVCVGETKEERAAGKTDQVVLSQLDAIVSRVGADNLSKMVIAYEPVWAIGTGVSATPDQAQEVHETIRKFLVDASAHDGAGVRLLYGGSVKAETAAGLFRMNDIDGALVGGASLVHEEFLSIARSAALLAKDAQAKSTGARR
jgi:triosephosphate isomerase